MSSMKKGKKRAKMGPWPRLQKFWDIRAACNFIGGGTGSGLLIIAALSIVMGQVLIAPVIAGVISICFGLMMVFLEIGRPWRSINMFFHPQTSWMTREGIVVMPLFLCAALVVYYADQLLVSSFAGFMGFFALVFLYCQVRILHAARGIPAWNHPSLKPYIFTTGLTEATGIALCLPELNSSKELMLVLAVLLIVRLLLWINYTKQLELDGAPEASCNVFEAVLHKLILSQLFAVGFLVVAWYKELLLFSVMAGLIAAFSGWTIKAIIVTRAAQTRGFSIPRTPVRGQGKSRILGRQR